MFSMQRKTKERLNITGEKTMTLIDGWNSTINTCDTLIIITINFPENPEAAKTVMQQIIKENTLAIWKTKEKKQ
jgi:hypothetical protein